MQEEFGDAFIPFEYHISGVFSTDETAARGGWYGVGGVPAVRIDGKYAFDGATSCDQTAGAYRSRIQQRLQETGGSSPVRVDGSFIPGDEEVRVEATFELVDAVVLTSLHAMLILYEDEIPYNGKHWQHVVRDVIDEPIVLANAGDRVTISRTIPNVGGWSGPRIHAIAFLQQTTGDHTVIQAARLPYGDFDVDLARRVVSLPSGNGTATFDALVRNRGLAPDTFTVGLGTGSFAGWAASIEGSTERPLASGAEALVRVRVRTDAIRAVRAGELRISSLASGREVVRELRLFNGARSLLVVDDDGNRADESSVLEALGANSLPYDDWDSYNEHGQDSPLFEELCDYEVVLWHTGFDLATYPLDRFDIDALDRLMADGGAICLTSQCFLNGLSGMSDFVRDDLGIASWTLDTGYVHLDGAPGDPIGDALQLDLQFGGPYQGKGDDAVPAATAFACLTAPNGSRAMLRNVAPNGARSVFMPVALNSVSAAGADPNNLRTVVGRIFHWLEEPMAADAPAVDAAPDLPILRLQPNPTHGEARVSFDLDSTGPVRLEVFDVGGRLLHRLIDEALPVGRHERAWVPSGSGIQIVRLTTPAGQSSAKLITLDQSRWAR